MVIPLPLTPLRLDPTLVLLTFILFTLTALSFSTDQQLEVDLTEIHELFIFFLLICQSKAGKFSEYVFKNQQLF
jgi:hypothetical protein